MMHEAEFKEIILLYKQLRKEGVVFPPRDPSEKFMIQFKGTQSPIFQTIEENKLYEEPNKQFGRKHDKKSTKDFISDSYGNNPITSAQPKVNYMGQNYEAQRRADQQEIEEEVEECDYIDDDEVTIVRESCILLDDIMTHAQHLNELRSEIAMEVVEAHEISLKKLKKLFLQGQSQPAGPERNKMIVLYQTLKRQLTDFYEMVDEFKYFLLTRSNKNKRPEFLDYSKMKMKGIEDLKKWSDETTTYSVNDNHSETKPQPQNTNPTDSKQNNDEVDLLGLDIGTPDPKPLTTSPQNPPSSQNLPKPTGGQKQSPTQPEKKNQLPPPPVKEGRTEPKQEMDLGSMDLLGDSPSPAPLTGNQAGKVTNLDLFNLNLNINPNLNIQNDDDDFFALIASKKNQLLTKLNSDRRHSFDGQPRLSAVKLGLYRNKQLNTYSTKLFYYHWPPVENPESTCLN